MMKKKNQTGLFFCLLLIGSSVSGAPVDFNNYTAGKIASSGTFTTNLLDATGNASGFVLKGGGSFQLSIEDSAGKKCVRLNSKNSQAAALIASEKPLALSDNWKITVEFSVSSPVPSGPLLFGLYRAGTADKKGAYVSDAVLPGGPDKDGSKAVVAMQLVIRPSALFAFSFIDKGNVPRQPGSGLQGDITGKTNYCIEFECNGTAIVATLRQAGGKILDGNQIRISDIEARIGQTVEFAAGDIINNSTSGWDIDIYNIEFVAK